MFMLDGTVSSEMGEPLFLRFLTTIGRCFVPTVVICGTACSRTTVVTASLDAYLPSTVLSQYVTFLEPFTPFWEITCWSV